MGTRNLTMVINKDNELKVAQYGQWDGYPEGQGTTILEFARDKDKIQKLIEKLNIVKFYNKNDNIIQEFKEFVEKFSNNTKRPQDYEYWFKMLQSRDLGGEILQSILDIDTTQLPKEHNNTIYLRNEKEFLNDSFCEWAYCINLHNNTLDVYENGNNKIMDYDLDNLPSQEDFCEQLNTIANLNQ